MARDIEKSIKKLGKEQISFDEIRTIVIDMLEKNGFKDVAKAYMNF
ncbi:ATP cone domain-containing protein [Thermoanaerobacter mathranii]